MAPLCFVSTRKRIEPSYVSTYEVWHHRLLLHQTKNAPLGFCYELLLLRPLFSHDLALLARYVDQLVLLGSTNSRYNSVVENLMGTHVEIDDSIRTLLVYLKTLNMENMEVSCLQSHAVKNVIRHLDLWLGELLQKGRVNYAFVHQMA